MAQPRTIITVAQFLHTHLKNRPRPDLPDLQRLATIARARALVAACRASLITGGSQPCYDPDLDTIVMPHPLFFRVARLYTPASKYALILLHELTHWSGHRHRLGRQPHRQQFDAVYNREELIAELGACLLAHDLGIAAGARLPHARYLNAFLATLPNPEVDLAVALSHANRAAAYLTTIAHRRLTTG